jgi:succinate dehydrogenase/fumarate reductase flavoprotein subunit
MTYPPSLAALKRRVEATRPRRLSETFAKLTLEEKQELLHAHHPDFVEGRMRPLAVGASQGLRMPVELADVIEGRSHLDPEAFEVREPDLDVDVLVIGGGGAGTAAALTAREHGVRVTLVTKLRHGDANTMMAQGGIQAADQPLDSPAIHYLDVIGGGGFSNVPELVEALVRDAPGIIMWLEELGCIFDKEPDGRMKTVQLGGSSRKRVHTAKDYTGMEIMRTLREEFRTHPDLTVIEFAPAIELLSDETGRCTGAVLQNMETGGRLIVRAKGTIMATGGSGRLHYQGFPTTNHYGATGDGLAIAYRLGAELAFLDAMQYHPTGAAFPEQILGLLVTEKLRAMDAQLVNVEGEQFVYHLETRDAVASANIRECQERQKGIRTASGQLGVWLDTPMVELLHGQGTIIQAFSAMYRQFGRFGIDIRYEPVLVYPTFHYQNGGLVIDAQGRTTVPGLFSAGEVSGGVHGRNRLGGNSLLEVLVYGRRAGRAAATQSRDVRPGRLSLAHVARFEQACRQAGLEDRIRSPVLLPDYTRSQHTRDFP